MTALLVMLIILVLPPTLAWLSRAVGGPRLDLRTVGEAGLALMFVFTASGHCPMLDLMADMLPPWVPGHHVLVIATGLLELTIAAALIVPRTRLMAGWAAIAVLTSCSSRPTSMPRSTTSRWAGTRGGRATCSSVRPFKWITLWVYWLVVRNPSRRPGQGWSATAQMLGRSDSSRARG